MFLSFLHILMAPGGVADPYGMISRHSHWLCNSCPGIPATAGEAMPPFLAESQVFLQVFLQLPRYCHSSRMGSHTSIGWEVWLSVFCSGILTASGGVVTPFLCCFPVPGTGEYSCSCRRVSDAPLSSAPLSSFPGFLKVFVKLPRYS